MRDRLLTYAIAASIAVHLVLLGLVGKTSAAKPIEVEQLKIVKVDLVKAPDQPIVPQDKSEAPKPRIEAPDEPYVPPVHRMTTDTNPPKPRPPGHTPGRVRQPAGRTTTAALPGNPGGPLAGLGSPNGENLGPVTPGNTHPGSVPGPEGGQGSGPGSDPGVGNPEPDPTAHSGPGGKTGPEIVAPPPPPPPPPPRMVSETVCAVSGMLPGPHCERKETRSFREGSQPTAACNVCKAPEHHSTHADRQEPELVRDCQPNIPEMDESGEYTVQIRYTVNTDGSVSDVQVIDSSGIPAIDRAVAAAASKMHYRPAVQNGEPRAVKIKRRYSIRI